MALNRSSRALPPGKVPPAVLESLLAGLPGVSDAVLLGPALGEDAAAVRIGTGLLAAAADPITFPTPRPGWYAVHVNANDLAVTGAEPAFFLLTILAPEGVSARDLQRLLQQAGEAAAGVGGQIAGGHTEITPAVRSVVVSGAAFGPLWGDRPIRTGGARPGDALLQVREFGIEGTSILAVEYRDRLVRRFGEDFVETAARFSEAPGISVVAAARRLVRRFDIHAMHDPTEGGVATGIREIALASGCGVRVHRNAFCSAAETMEICRELRLDPLGIISSGSLLAALPPDQAEPAVREFQEQQVPAAVIGRFSEDSGVLELVEPDGKVRPLPEFETDELAGISGTPENEAGL